MPSKQCGISRDWSKEQLSVVSERLSLRSGTASATASARFVNSVSDLYAPDEIDALLDEIQDFEPIQVQRLVDELYDEGLGSARVICHGPGNGCSLTNVNSMNYERSSVHSWDSHRLHTHTHEMGDSEARGVGGPVSMYCDSNHFKTPIGILRIILIVCCLCSLGCLCSSGTSVYGLFSLPFVARIRLMLFVILWTLLLTVLLLFLDVSLLYQAFPFHYHRMAVCIYAMECAGFIGSSLLIASLTQVYRQSFPWIAKVTRDQLLATSVFGFISGAIAMSLTLYGFYELCRFHFPNKREDTDQLTLAERGQQTGRSDPPTQQQQQQQQQPRAHKHQGTTEPMTTTVVWPIHDDVQPCSSKHSRVPPNNNFNNANNVGLVTR